MTRRQTVRAAFVLCVFAVMEVAVAQDYQIIRHTINSGGGVSSGGGYALTGTIGQPAAGWSEDRDSGYGLLGGFFGGGYPVCFVTFEDFALFSAYWLMSGDSLPGDFDDSGNVDINDLPHLAYYWLNYCPVDWSLK